MRTMKVNGLRSMYRVITPLEDPLKTLAVHPPPPMCTNNRTPLHHTSTHHAHGHIQQMDTASTRDIRCGQM